MDSLESAYRFIALGLGLGGVMDVTTLWRALYSKEPNSDIFRLLLGLRERFPFNLGGSFSKKADTLFSGLLLCFGGLSVLLIFWTLVDLPSAGVVVPFAVFYFLTVSLRCHLEDSTLSLRNTGVVVLFFYTALGEDSWLGYAGLWLIVSHLAIAYVFTGLSKLRSRSWRNGSRFRYILNGSRWRNTWLAKRFDQFPGGIRALSWGIITLELSAPLLWIAGDPILTGSLLLLCLMHLSIGLAMGIMSFAVFFPACFPAIYVLLSESVRF